MNKKIIIILIPIFLLIMTTIIVLTIFNNKTQNTVIEYNCGLTSKGEFYDRTDIFYVTKNSKSLYKQQVTSEYYFDKDAYLSDKANITEQELDAVFDDDNLTITIYWRMEKYFDKELDETLKEIESKKYTCQRVKNQKVPSQKNNEACEILVKGNKASIKCEEGSECTISEEGPFMFTTEITGTVIDKNGKKSTCSAVYTQPTLPQQYSQVHRCDRTPYCIGTICVC